MKAVTIMVISMLMSAFAVMAIIFLVSAVMTAVPYFRQWLQRKLEKALEPKNCNNCKYRTTDYTVFPLNHYCNMHDKNIEKYSSCNRWERIE